jgi:phospholipase C
MLLAQNMDSVPVTTQTVTVLNHIIFMVQENRGLDHYFGALRRGKAVEDADLLNS